LAEFARRIGPPVMARPAEKQLLVEQRITRRRQLLVMRTMESNHLEAGADRLTATQVRKHVRLLDQQIEELDREITQMSERDEDWRGKDRIVQSVTGVGPVTRATLLAKLPEWGITGSWVGESGAAEAAEAKPKRPLICRSRLCSTHADAS
jgi:transposase